MEGEFNNFAINNTPITFTGKTDNIATSDELTATPLYQDNMGTAYSKKKGVVKVVNFVGISLILTAAAIKTGSLLSNAYVLNPPSLSNTSYVYKDHVFTFSFTVTNKGKYEMNYYLLVNKEQVLTGDCSEEKEYTGSYEKFTKGDKCEFYIEFTNRVDYKKTISNYKFTVED